MSVRITSFRQRAVGRGCVGRLYEGLRFGRTRSGRHPWTQPGVFRWSEGSDPKGLNVILDSASPTLDLAMFIFSWAIRYDGKGHPVPDALAKSPRLPTATSAKTACA